jgi:uncharacterized protein with GYD domain
MPIFVVLGNFTGEGVKGLKNLPKAYESAKKLVESVGGKLLGHYYTFGRYDWVSIVEGPNLENAMKALMMFGMGGGSRTETLVGISIEETFKLIAEIPSD